MGRRYKVDVMGTIILQAQHFSCQLIYGQGTGVVLLKLLADLIILAEHAGEIAAGEKNGAGTSSGGDGWFFSRMEAGMTNLNQRRDPAEPNFTVKSVHPAVARATFTSCQLFC
jgi:hypothetical protein